MEMMEGQEGLWEGAPHEIEERLSQIEAVAHAKKEKEREEEAAREKRPKWTATPSSHKQETGRSIRKRMLKERRKGCIKIWRWDLKGKQLLSLPDDCGQGATKIWNGKP